MKKIKDGNSFFLYSFYLHNDECSQNVKCITDLLLSKKVKFKINSESGASFKFNE